MTGLHLSRHGSYNIGVNPRGHPPYLSARFREAGYFSAHFGKSHWNAWGWEGSPEFMGRSPEDYDAPFRDFSGFEEAELSIGHGNYGVAGHYHHWARERGFDPRNAKVNHLWEGDPNGTGTWNLPTALHSGQWTVERALDRLRKQRSDSDERPFFLHLGFQDPHHPHLLPEDFTRRVDPDRVPPPSPKPDEETNPPPHLELFRDGTLQDSRFRGRFEMAGQGRAAWGPYFADPEKSRLTRAHYYSLIHLLDDQLGTLWRGLEELGLWENTVILFTSDHGEMLGDHLIGQKGPLCFEPVLRVPFLLLGPNGVPAGKTVDSPVSLVDVAPTLAELAGLPNETPHRMDGISLVPLLHADTRADWTRTGVRSEYKEEPDRIRYLCWITSDWKLCLYQGETFGELYHLATDPLECHNRFHDPGCAEIRAELTAQLLEDFTRSDPLGPRYSRV